MTQKPGLMAPASPAPASAPPEQRACLFALAGFRFAVDVRSAREVVLFDEITVVPLAPRHLVGVANLRGTVMPIVNIRALLDLPVQQPGSSVRTLVLRAHPLQAAVVVDAVLGLEPFEEISPPEPGGPGPAAPDRRRFAAGHVKWGAESVLLLDALKILEALKPHQLRLASGTAEE
jgi:chemotaxis signal transduction protein